MSDRGTLERLVIKAYERPDYSGQPVDQFEAYINPNEITIAYEIEYDSARAPAPPAADELQELKHGRMSLTLHRRPRRQLPAD